MVRRKEEVARIIQAQGPQQPEGRCHHDLKWHRLREGQVWGREARAEIRTGSVGKSISQPGGEAE